MLVKILGVFDILASAIIFLISFGLNIPQGFIIFLVIVLFAKGAFILTGSIASIFDIIGAVVLILSLFFALPHPVFFIAGILILQKGFMSLV